MVLQLQIGRISLETDAAMVKQAVISTDYDLSICGGLVLELKQLLVTNFVSFQSYMSRECNRVDHVLALLGSACLAQSELVLVAIPVCITRLVAKDISDHE
uniref:RNase H type-1 domain-containing protein n=1 Tax=Oryza nivara TaxID=4536 RepID=A0A0E0G6I0_ORYNI